MGKARNTRGGYPQLRKTLQLVAQEADADTRAIKTVEIHMLASGEATYRVYPADGGEPDGGVIQVGGDT